LAQSDASWKISGCARNRPQTFRYALRGADRRHETNNPRPQGGLGVPSYGAAMVFVRRVAQTTFNRRKIVGLPMERVDVAYSSQGRRRAWVTYSSSKAGYGLKGTRSET